MAGHARYANLLLDRPVDPAATAGLRAAVGELTGRAIAAGTVAPGITATDVMALVRGMRGLVQAAGEADPRGWPRFLTFTWPGCGRQHARHDPVARPLDETALGLDGTARASTGQHRP